MTYSLKTAVLSAMVFGAMSLVSGAQEATAQTSCNLPCLQQVVETCANDNSATANWWEAGTGFQTCVASNAPGTCDSSFVRVQEPSGISIVVQFRPDGSRENCLIPTSERD